MKLITTYITCTFFLLFSLLAFGNEELKESYGIALHKLPVNLNNQNQVIDIDVQWDYRPKLTKNDYIDSNLIIADIKYFLKSYPSPKDYWEIINHNLSLFLSKKYPQMETVTIKLTLPPTKTDNYFHFSTVKAVND